jgi:hypothetical protein
MIYERYLELKKQFEKMELEELKLRSELETDKRREYALRELLSEKTEIKALLDVNALVLGIKHEILN